MPLWVASCHEVVEDLKKAIEESGLTKSQWAEKHGIHRATVANVLRGGARPTPKLCDAIGWVKSNKMYRRKNDQDRSPETL
jgi:gp16 family phage-associated protein